MRTDDLIWFAAIAKMGSISAAAASLGVSQPTLSKAVARLERHTRTPLLERQARGVRLTAYGRVLHDYAQRLDVTLTDMMAHLRDLRQGTGGVLRWGVGAGIPNDWVLPTCAALHTDGVSIEIAGGYTDVLMQELLQGSLDVVLIGAPGAVDPPARWQRIASDPMVVLAPRAHALCATPRPSLKHLAAAQWLLPGPQTFTRKDFETCFQRAGLAPPPAAVCARASLRDVALAKTLNLLLLLPQSLAHTPAVAEDFAELRPPQWQSRREIGFAWRGDGYPNPLIKRCVQLVQRQVKARALGAP